ncbi:PREDICTED: ATP-dependent RNA helicase DHH1-like [Ceratosolen solmsi marchali]|uniref:ATP-dependent RNA helicase DHH1-like n=1 Tax=Ceratosolen solmsi marchali TaxID=326594 RepID=A0AAJ6YL20_9HYME|nr:PREDICTED: ATP-dependent RNA helicase DHH1-like [Ceratosolen solmsi marchali]
MWYLIVGSFFFSACAGQSIYTDRVGEVRVKRQGHQQPQPQQVPVQNYNYRPYNEAPDRIKQLLQAQQAREPLVHLPAPHQQQPAPIPAGPHAATASQHQQVPQAQTNQYTPKVQYGQAPPQPTYKGVYPAQPSPQPGPVPQNTYTPQYKQRYNPQTVPTNQVPAPAPAPYHAQPQAGPSQFPKNLPPHIQKIIESQRAFQG